MPAIGGQMRGVRGFGLIELIIVIAIVAILATTVVPSFGRLLDRIRLTTTVNDYIAAVHGARNYAVRDNYQAILCPSSDGEQCDSEASFESGWLITTDSADTQATVRSWAGPEVSITTTNYPDNGRVRFDARGLPLQGDGGLLVNDMEAEFCVGGQGREVSMAPTGRVDTTSIDC